MKFSRRALSEDHKRRTSSRRLHIVSVALLGVPYGVAQSQMASTLFVSVVSSLFTLDLFIALTGA